MILFDIGANVGGATEIGLAKGYKVIAIEAAPRIFVQLVHRFIYHPDVVLLRCAVSDKDDQYVDFYETLDTDALSTLNLEWLTSDTMPYNGFRYRTVKVNTITIDKLAEIYGKPDLIKIDVEGAEWSALKGMTKNYGEIAFEWTLNTINEHEKQLDYLHSIGFREFAPQYIVEHLERPTEWFPLEINNKGKFVDWWLRTKDAWEAGGWKVASLRVPADVGMLWAR